MRAIRSRRHLFDAWWEVRRAFVRATFLKVRNLAARRSDICYHAYLHWHGRLAQG